MWTHNEKLSGWIEHSAYWLSNLRSQDTPDGVRQIVRLQTAGFWAAVLSGCAVPEVQALSRSIPPCSGNMCGPDGVPRSFPDLLTLLSVAAMAQDYDDYLFMGHTGHSAVLASTIPLPDTAAREGAPLASGANYEAEALIIAGNEIGGRLGAFAALGPHNGQMWNHIHRPVAAAIFARRLGGSAEQIQTAMEISLYQPNSIRYPGFFGSDAKMLTAAEPLLAGWYAATAAIAGWQSNTDLLAADEGAADLFATAPLPGMLDGLGEVWVTETVAVKPYPGCAYVDTTIDALEILGRRYREKHGEALPPEEIVRVSVRASILTMVMDAMSQAFVRGETLRMVPLNFSVSYSVALWLLAGKLSGDTVRSDEIQSHKEMLKILAGKVKLSHDGAATLKLIQSLDRAINIRRAVKSVSIPKLLRALRQARKHTGGDWPPALLLIRNIGQALTQRQKLFVLVRIILYPIQFLVTPLLRKLRGTKVPRFSLADADFSQPVLVFPAKVSITFRDGTRWQEVVELPHGAAQGETFESTVKAKWLTASEPALSGDECARLWTRLQDGCTLIEWIDDLMACFRSKGVQ